MKKVDKISHALSESIVNRPRSWVILSLFILFSTMIGLPQIKSNFSVKMWLYDNDQKILDLREHENTFGSSETIDVILYQESGAFNKETIETVQKITDEMWLIKDVIRVESIVNHNWVSAEEDDIIITPFLDEEVDLTPKLLQEKKDIALSDNQIVSNFVSPSGNLIYIRSYLKTYSSQNPPYGAVVKEVETMLEKYERPGLKFHLSGIAYINDSLSKASDRDMLLVFPIILLVLIGILFYFFKTPLGIIFPFSLIGLSIISTFGLEGLLGLPFNNIISAVPAVIIAIGLADAIHIMISYRHNILVKKENNTLAAKNSLKKNFIPTVLTTITTSVGFFSLATANIVPIHDLGILCGIGTIFAWIYTYTFLGPLLKHIKFKPQKGNESLKGLDFIFDFCFKYKKVINISMPIFAIIMIYLGSLNVINSDPIGYFAKSTDIRKTFARVRSEIGGSRTIELVFDSEKSEGIKNPTFLKKSEKLIDWIEKRKEVVKVNSIIQIIKKMNQTLHQGKVAHNIIPSSRRAVSDLLFLYTLGLPQGMDLKNQISLDNRKFKLLLTWDVNDTMLAVKKIDEIISKASSLGVKVYEGGQSPIYNRVNDLVVRTFFTSMALSIPLIFFIILFVFKDLKLSILSLIPNLFPLGVASGVMYLSGDEINIGNVIVFSVCLGIAVDDTIHFIANYKIKLNKGLDNLTAIKSTLEQTGKALILTTLMLSLSFGLFALGEFIPNQKFGIYCALILTLALLADLVLLPAILMVGEKQRKN